MIVLTLRTDKPEAELGLFDSGVQVAYLSWHAHRQLAETIHQKIKDMLAEANLGLTDIEGIVCFQGPGSFTGLRIGMSVANALEYSLDIPIVATQGSDWLQEGLERLSHGENDTQAQPFYGADVHIAAKKVV